MELFFVEAALLIESGYEKIVDEMWYVYAREDVRRRRLSRTVVIPRRRSRGS